LARYQIKKIWKPRTSTKLDKGYRLVYEFSYFNEKKILQNFHYKGGPLPKKSRKFFLNQIWQFIPQSIALVEFSRNMLLLNFFEVISGQKNLKNHVKIRLFKRRFEISCFGSKISKKWRFLIILKAENHFANYILQNELLIVAFGCVSTVL